MRPLVATSNHADTRQKDLNKFAPSRHLPHRADEWLNSGTALHRLRKLMPDRRLETGEAYAIAERQAMLLLAICGVDSVPVPAELIGELSAVTLRRLSGIPVAGTSFWSRSQWFIVIDGHPSIGLQRMVVAHEFKHVVDHRRAGRYVDEDVAEAVAEFFARCVMLPRPWVKVAIGRGAQSRHSLACLFGVPATAVAIRLDELGLSGDVKSASRFSWRRRSTHLRTASPRR